MPASCQYTCPAVNPCCQYTRPTVNTPSCRSLLSIPTIHPPPVNTPAPLLIHLHSLLLLWAVVLQMSHDVVGAQMPTSLKEGRGKEWDLNLLGLMQSAYSPVVGPGWNLQVVGGTMASFQLYRHTGDKGYFKSQYIELVITFSILNQKLCFWGH